MRRPPDDALPAAGLPGFAAPPELLRACHTRLLVHYVPL